MQSNVKKIFDILEKSNTKKTEIVITCKINDIEFSVFNKDILGSLIQSWLEEVLNKNKISWSDKGTQKYPDFILENNQYLEVKTYNKDATPGFDIANFKGLIDDLVINPKRLNSDYIIFNYIFDENIEENNKEDNNKNNSNPHELINKNSKTETKIILNDYWIKKIWEITRIPIGNKKNKISAQVKQGTIFNLRPYNFVINPEDCIKDRIQFVEQLKKTIDEFSDQLIKENTIYKDSNEWFSLVKSKYKEQTNEEL